MKQGGNGRSKQEEQRVQKVFWSRNQVEEPDPEVFEELKTEKEYIRSEGRTRLELAELFLNLLQFVRAHSIKRRLMFCATDKDPGLSNSQSWLQIKTTGDLQNVNYPWTHSNVLI